MSNQIWRSVEELDSELDDELDRLNHLCDDFDSGRSNMGPLIALSIRKLVYDTGNSRSILKILGVKDTLSYLDTGVYRALWDIAAEEEISRINPDMVPAFSSATEVGLIELGDMGNGRVGWFAPLRLDRFPAGSLQSKATRGVAQFAAWWEDPLVESSSGKVFSRFRLVSIMANRDGGAHVDPSIDTDYYDLKKDPLLQMEYVPDGGTRALGDDILEALNNVAYACVRQIAFELFWTIKRYLHVKANPGILALRKPFEALPLPSPPHQPLMWNPLFLTMTSRTP